MSTKTTQLHIPLPSPHGFSPLSTPSGRNSTSPPVDQFLGNRWSTEIIGCSHTITESLMWNRVGQALLSLLSIVTIYGSRSSRSEIFATATHQPNHTVRGKLVLDTRYCKLGQVSFRVEQIAWKGSSKMQRDKRGDIRYFCHL